MSSTFTFGQVDRVALFGGSQLIPSLCEKLAGWPSLRAKLFTSPRHIEEAVNSEGLSLRRFLESLRFPFEVVDDVNTSESLTEFVTANTLGLACGAAWVFSQSVVELFGGKIVDFMGINLPQFRGGAHYSWQILMGNKNGACNLQLILGGTATFHRGSIIKRREYLFPPEARVPQDYFDAAVPVETAFLSEFFDQVLRSDEFEVVPLMESFSSYFPFLSTDNQGFIDWRWDVEALERFICAFDSPYRGASTFLQDQRVRVKQCSAQKGEGTFHPFQAGLVFKNMDGALWVAAPGGALVIHQVLDESGRDITSSVELGARLMTPQNLLERAMSFGARYDSKGLVT